MKYVFSILLIAVVFTIITTGLYFNQKENPEVDPCLVINDRVISTSEFENLYRNQPHAMGDRQQLIESLITRELLIQEAMKMGLDQEEAFRHSIQNFYAQSLTRILLERKYDSFHENPSQQEIDRFLELQGYQVELTLLPVSDQSAGEKKHTGAFRDLGTSMQVAVISLAVGEISEPVLLNDLAYALRLDSRNKLPAEDTPGMTSGEAGTIILLDRQEQALGRWLYDLRKQAEVKVSPAISAER